MIWFDLILTRIYHRRSSADNNIAKLCQLSFINCVSCDGFHLRCNRLETWCVVGCFYMTLWLGSIKGTVGLVGRSSHHINNNNKPMHGNFITIRCSSEELATNSLESRFKVVHARFKCLHGLGMTDPGGRLFACLIEAGSHLRSLGNYDLEWPKKTGGSRVRTLAAPDQPVIRHVCCTSGFWDVAEEQDSFDNRPI